MPTGSPMAAANQKHQSLNYESDDMADEEDSHVSDVLAENQAFLDHVAEDPALLEFGHDFKFQFQFSVEERKLLSVAPRSSWYPSLLEPGDDDKTALDAATTTLDHGPIKHAGDYCAWCCNRTYIKGSAICKRRSKGRTVRTRAA